LLQQQEPHNFILGVRDTKSTEAAYNDLKSDNSKHTIRILPLNLSNLRSVQFFAQQALSQLGSKNLDYLFLNAGMLDDASGPGPNGSEWCEGFIVNHLGELFPITRQASIYDQFNMLK
jgi:NADP-dependent 3-hydroxy acid dehydrogenase YdfG